MEPRYPAKGDRDFESYQNTYPIVSTPQQNSPAIIPQNHSKLDTITEDEEEDDDDE